MTAITLGVLGTLSVLAVWAVIVELGLVSAKSLPSPFAVAGSLPALLADPNFSASLADTLGAWFVAMVIASVSAIVLGMIIGTVHFLSAPAMIVVNALRSIPSSALIPIAILLFGLGSSMKIAVAVYAIFALVLINTIYGVAGREPMRIDAARSMRWNWWQQYLHLTLPSATPSIVTGIRLAAGISLVVVISTELLGAKSGIGITIIQYQQALRIDMAYACITAVGIVGVLLYSILAAAERATIDRIRLV
ncbi:ABC transporter permease [Subtercola boreus]|nr:ABC transporter permease [Subtercola boreus]TQL52942.1 ABC-type nitrate/sulfonate/bicarbonate transport system permease component [Subtercola boreus]